MKITPTEKEIPPDKKDTHDKKEVSTPLEIKANIQVPVTKAKTEPPTQVRVDWFWIFLD